MHKFASQLRQDISEHGSRPESDATCDEQVGQPGWVGGVMGVFVAHIILTRYILKYTVKVKYSSPTQ